MARDAGRDRARLAPARLRGERLNPLPLSARRARIAARHHLGSGAPASSPLEASTDLVGLHGTDPTSAYLACWARVPGFATADLDQALYEDRSLLKIVGMRRTMFIVPVELAGVIQAACTESIAKGQRERLVRMIEGAGIATPGGPWLDRVEAEALDALDRLGGATAAELGNAVEDLRAQIPFGEGTRWQSTVSVATRLLFLLSAEARIIRGRPKGTLVSSLYRWVPMNRWVPGGLASIPKGEAQAELVRRYLGTYGPATLVDIKWWTGWTVAETKRTLGEIRAVEVELEDGGIGWVVAGDDDPGEPASGRGAAGPGGEPWIGLLPALDSSIMGWQERGWFLEPHRTRLFDRNGNAGPTIWIDGRTVGGWAQRRSGEIRYQLLEDVGREATIQIESRAEALREWLGPLRFLPRFRTPVEQELTA